MARGKGSNTWVGIGEESTFGTGVAPDVYTRDVVSESLQFTTGTDPKPVLGITSQFKSVSMRKSVAGSVVLNPGFNGALGWLCKHALGSVGTTNPGTAAYQHTFSCANSLPTGLSFHVNRDAANIGTAYRYAGCKVNALTFRQEGGEPLEVEAAVTGVNETKEAVGSPSFPTFVSLNYSQISTMTMNDGGGAATFPLMSFEVNIENPLNEDDYLINSLTRSTLERSEVRSISGNFTIQFDDVTEYDYYRDQDELDIIIVYNAGTDSIESGHDYTLTFNLNNAKLGEASTAVSDFGPLALTTSFQCYASSSLNDEATIVLKNTDTAYT